MKFYTLTGCRLSAYVHKFLLVMKLTLVLLITAFLQVSSAAHAQKITFSGKNTSIVRVFAEIQNQTGYTFLYTDEMLDGVTPLNVDFKNTPLEDALEKCFRNQPLTYTIKNKLIVIQRKTRRPEVQVIVVNGTVTDEKGEPLPGVTVTVKGKNTNTTTDRKGTYSISIPPGETNAVLVYSFIGFETREITVADQATINVKLKIADNKLNEIVVIGYGTQKKALTTSAVSTVKGASLANAPVANISNALTGQVAGISMRPNGGQPGYDNPDLHVRGISTTGNNSPLIVVDGVIRNNISEIDPNSIATVSVLKDAAAVAPYGLGGANGVILITTKRGQTGIPTLSFNSYTGIQNPTYLPKMLNAQDYMRLVNEAYLNVHPGGTALPYADTLINNYAALNRQHPDLYPNSNASSQIRRKNAPERLVNLQLSGGTKDVKYYAGVGVFDQQGMFSPVSYRRYNYNLNLDVNATPTTTVLLSLNGAVENTNGIDPGTSMHQFIRGLLKYLPTAPLYYANGNPGQSAGNSPAAVLNSGGYYRKNQNTLLSSIGVEQKLNFLPGLSVKAVFSYDPASYVEKGWHEPYYYYTQNTGTTPYTYTQQISTSEATATTFTSLYENYWQRLAFSYQGYLTYHHTFGKNDISGLIVAEEDNNSQLNFGASRNNFALNIDELSLGSSDKNNFDNGGGSSTGSQVGYVYRLDYAYDGKYLFEGAGRYDGHYYFAPGKRYAYFPAFSAGWVLSREKFFPQNKVVDYLKIRGSWGKSGNLAGGAFQYLNGYSLYGNSYAFGTGTTVQGSYQAREANPDITWEISTKENLGFEANLWQGWLKIDADYFWEKRTNMLLPPAVTVPVEYGIALSQQNAGIMQNHGLDLTIGSQHQFNNGINLSLNGNFSYAKNKLIQVFESPTTYNNPNRRVTGRPLGTMFGYQANGLFTAADDKNQDGVINTADGYNVTQFGTLHPGDIKYADLNHDGKIDSQDLTAIGNPVYPTITYGFTAAISWKGFDISALFQGAAVMSMNTMGFQTVPFSSNNSNVSYQYFHNRWTPGNQNALYPRVEPSPTANNNQFSSFWIVNDSYLRLKTASIGYTLPALITQRWGIRKLRIYASGQNVATFSKLNFEDPEVGYSNGEESYPQQKVFTLGINVTF